MHSRYSIFWGSGNCQRKTPETLPDVRIGVQIAQSFGVRVHLLGIEANKSSQSPLLMQEADTTSMWMKLDVEKFLSAKPQPSASAALASASTKTANIDQVAIDLAHTLDQDQILSFAEYRKSNSNIPSEFDGKLLARARDQIQRDLTQGEKRSLRAKFVDEVKSRNPSQFEN
jgi:hypothetical protein